MRMVWNFEVISHTFIVGRIWPRIIFSSKENDDDEEEDDNDNNNNNHLQFQAVKESDTSEIQSCDNVYTNP
jgi:hypothetical protein